jgi:hypothetical protein
VPGTCRVRRITGLLSHPADTTRWSEHVGEAERREVFAALEPGLGGRVATLMTHGPRFDWSDIARRSDLVALRADVQAEFAVLRGEMEARFTAVRSEIAGFRGELRGEIGELRGEMDGLRGEMDGLRGEMDGLRGELNGRLDGLTGRLLLMNIPVVFATAGLVLAAVKLG